MDAYPTPEAAGAAGASASVARISRDLVALGVRRGGLLLVHSSLKSLGPVPGGPETVIRGMLDALGPDSTLLLPALSYSFVTPQDPVFDVRVTKSCVGAIPEHFRTRTGTLRSVHPTHSVAATGPRAQALLGDHLEDTTPVGPHSAFRKMRDLGGQLLFLGCGMEPNTSMHGVEELVEPPYLYDPAIDYRLTLADGTTIAKRYRPHGFANVHQRYDRMEELLEPKGLLKAGPVLAAKAHLVDAGPVWELGEAALRLNPWAFVDRKDR
ncbi:MAG: AAC(3) family N-acetyltransferase [Candidatus Coatesbacteria bacterium]